MDSGGYELACTQVSAGESGQPVVAEGERHEDAVAVAIPRELTALPPAVALQVCFELTGRAGVIFPDLSTDPHTEDNAHARLAAVDKQHFCPQPEFLRLGDTAVDILFDRWAEESLFSRTGDETTITKHAAILVCQRARGLDISQQQNVGYPKGKLWRHKKGDGQLFWCAECAGGGQWICGQTKQHHNEKHRKQRLEQCEDALEESERKRRKVEESAAVAKEREKKSCLVAVTKNPGALEYAPQEFRAEKEFMLQAVAIKGLALQYASVDLRADRDVVLKAVLQDWRALQFATITNDKQIVIAATEQDIEALQYTSPELRADGEFMLVVMVAVTQATPPHRRRSARAERASSVVQYASADLRADREFMLAVVAQNGCALQHASADLRADREVVLAAVKNDCHALRHASVKLRAKVDSCARELESLDLPPDREFMIKALQSAGTARST